jgi:hypothetical protein
MRSFEMPQRKPRRSFNPQTINLKPTSLEVTLNSADAQSLLWHLNLVDTALGRLGDEKVQEVQFVLKPLEDHLQIEYAKVDRMFKESGIEPLVKWTKPLQKAIDVFHPEARRFLNLLIGLDRMIGQLADLRFAGKIDESQFHKTRNDCRQALKDAATNIAKIVPKPFNV